MQTETAMGAKMTAKGIFAHEVRFKIALAEFQNNGGTFERAMSLAMAAYGKGSGGQSRIASNGQGFGADASRKNDGAGQHFLAVKATSGMPSPSPERNGA